ncbi:alpha/beta hydrolase [Caldicoprobacter algeriensis]|uniref:alpha/beta hydrolase n=1 Tax=Caldicoprobacter algeriensis TaxID=699281 RepID=UPI00207A464D|nr:alpha/beta hydrolase [Caldicoprobacter algeriensis]MCM8901105.1 alpha/beta hydrolase [Caldicoprobacter algeriensis]
MQKAVELHKNGMTLRGMLHKPEGVSGKLPTALIFHGFTGNKMEPHFIFVKLSRRLEQAGIASLRFDFLGSGESDGEFKDMTLSGELDDAEAILNYVKSLEFVDINRIFAVGLSMGGAVASMLAGRHPQDIAALCLWAPAGNMGQLIQERIKQIEAAGIDISSMEYFDLGGNLVGKAFVEDVQSLDIFKIAVPYDKQVLILHGDRDEAVPLKTSYRYLEIYGDRAKLHVIEGADHTFNKWEWEQEVIEKTVEFLKSHA